MVRGFAKLVAVWRGYHTRRFRTSSKVRNIAQKLLTLREKALTQPALLLSAQVSAAIAALQSGKMISQYMQACHTLRFATQVSHNSCEIFVRAHCVAILFKLVESCNRSTPHQELLRLVLLVLLNICQYESLAHAVAESNAADALLDLMQMFRDKRGIFTLAAELLALLARANNKTKEMLKSPSYRKRIEGITHIVERKHSLDNRVREADIRSALLARSTRKKRLSGDQFDQLESVTSLRVLLSALDM